MAQASAVVSQAHAVSSTSLAVQSKVLRAAKMLPASAAAAMRAQLFLPFVAISKSLVAQSKKLRAALVLLASAVGIWVNAALSPLQLTPQSN